MRPYVLIGLRKAAEYAAKKYEDEGKAKNAYLAGAVANLLNAERYMDLKQRTKLVDIAESIARMANAPNQQFVDLIQAYREELNRKEE